MPRHDPAHLGDIIREECLLPLGLSVTAAAAGLGVSRKTLSLLLNCHAGVSPEMAIRLEKAGWSRAEAWLKLRLAYDLWHARKRADTIEATRFPAALPV